MLAVLSQKLIFLFDFYSKKNLRIQTTHTQSDTDNDKKNLIRVTPPVIIHRSNHNRKMADRNFSDIVPLGASIQNHNGEWMQVRWEMGKTASVGTL